MKLLKTYNDKVVGFILEDVPWNAKYMSPKKFFKKSLHILTSKVQSVIHEEI
jgi:glutamate-1-semialdehyde aminotransferase